MVLSSLIMKVRTSNIGFQLLQLTYQKKKISSILNSTANMSFLSKHKLQEQVMLSAFNRTKPIQGTYMYQERYEHNYDF